VRILFDHDAWRHYLDVKATNPNLGARIERLIEECRRTPFSGIGKSEPLRNELKGWWSRRINEENRLVYRVSGASPSQIPEIMSCRHHYPSR